MRKKILLGFLLLLTTTIGSIPAYSDNGVTDKDNDSIPDNVDYCPNLPEDFEDEVDGCPSEHEIYHDQDQDGIQDHDDLCPNVPEIYNQYRDDDGCPDSAGGAAKGTPDSDGDGITRGICLGVNQPQVFKRILDLDGC